MRRRDKLKLIRLKPMKRKPKRVMLKRKKIRRKEKRKLRKKETKRRKQHLLQSQNSKESQNLHHHSDEK